MMLVFGDLHKKYILKKLKKVSSNNSIEREANFFSIDADDCTYCENNFCLFIKVSRTAPYE